MMYYVTSFFCGMLLCNCIPHLTMGLTGQPFPTPFAKPPGVGFSSPLVNFVWSCVNIAVALALFFWRPREFSWAAFLIGWFLIGVFNVRHFSKVLSERKRREAGANPP